MAKPDAILTPDLQAATEQLGETLLQAKPIAAYHQAKTRLDGDVEASALLEQYAAAQADLRARQVHNAATQASVDHLRSLDRHVRSNPVIMEYADAQQTALAYLAEVNLEISQLLGTNYATWARSGCC